MPKLFVLTSSAHGRAILMTRLTTMRVPMTLASIISAGVMAALPTIGPVAAAQLPPGATMLVPGVYTTPDISAKCSSYARSKTQPHEDNRRQTLALACAQKLWNQQMQRG